MIRTAFAAALLVAAAPASALLVRTDRDDAEYLDLATRYPAAVRLDAPVGGGVLISPRWVLTAAHVVDPMRTTPGRVKVVVGGKSREVQAVYVHPDWKRGAAADLALVHLRIPVEDVEPANLYRGTDEAGQTVRLVGHAVAGRIGEKAVAAPADRRPRAGVNTVDRIDALAFGLKVKGPDEASDLQGVLSAGDRGGPAFIEVDREAWLVGIGVATEDASGDGIPGNAGDWDVFVRVSAFREWINQATAKAAADEAAEAVGDTERR